MTKKQLEGQIVSTTSGISKKTIAESLAKNSIPQKMLSSTGANTGHMSTKSGKVSGAGAGTTTNYINETSLLMQAVSS